MLPDATLRHLQEVAEMPHFANDRYMNLRRIGSGGMGTVFVADDTLLERKVAIKVVGQTFLSGEAQTIAALEHPGIVPVHDRGTLDDGRTWYAMKFIDGQTLDEIRDATPLPRLLQIVRQTSDAVAFAHAHGIVHRDLKPSNIMVGAFGETLVMDWGVACNIGDATAPAAGTKNYAAPEQFEGALPAPSADVFSLGRVLQWVLSGAPAPPPALRSIVAKATSTDPQQRYPNATSFANDLTRYIDGLSVEAHRENVFELTQRWLMNNRAIAALVAAYVVMRIITFFITR